ncbi:MAG TPA: RNA polymerase sigma factor, partial [Gammaproteobacteria bacterium]|nr:RNA polymerase sigma factor [Gammaproteobacteria bacterium]
RASESKTGRPMSSTAVMNGRQCLAEEDRGLDLEAEMEAFLREVEKRAYRIAAMSIRDRDEALDLVQDAMINLTRHYARRPSEEWRPLFYRILSNRIRDWHRRRSVRDSILRFFAGQPGEEYDPVALASDPSANDPAQVLERAEAMEALERALAELPARQREAFVLRNFEGLDVAETALAMRCSDGSVKTHFSRATHRLRKILAEYY